MNDHYVNSMRDISPTIRTIIDTQICYDDGVAGWGTLIDGVPSNGYIQSSIEIIDAALEAIKVNIKSWNHEDINEMKDWLGEYNHILDQAQLLDDWTIEDYRHNVWRDNPIGYVNLPSEPIPEHIAGYPVWACDKKGMCLVGSDMTIEPLSDILEWYNR